jgi:hypothetical protein
MYGSSVAGGQGQVSEDPEGGTDEQQKEESVPMPSLRTLKRKVAFFLSTYRSSWLNNKLFNITHRMVHHMKKPAVLLSSTI